MAALPFTKSTSRATLAVVAVLPAVSLLTWYRPQVLEHLRAESRVGALSGQPPRLLKESLGIVGRFLEEGSPPLGAQDSEHADAEGDHVAPPGAEEEAKEENLAGGEETDKEEEEEEILDIEGSVMLLGVVGFVMVLFYLVHWHSAHIRHFSWRVISVTVSIFVAVTMFGAISGLAVFVLLENDEKEVYTNTVFNGVCFVLFYVYFQLRMHFSRRKFIALKATSTYGGHVCSFASLYFFGDIQERFGKSNFWAASAVVLGCAVVLLVLNSISDLIRSKIVDFDELRKELRKAEDAESSDADGDSMNAHEEVVKAEHLLTAEMRWCDECRDFENDVGSITIGFLISQLVRFCIMGVLPPIMGNPDGHDWSQSAWLFATSWFFECLVIVGAYVDHELIEWQFSNWKRRCVTTLLSCFATTQAFCFYFWGSWSFHRILESQTELMSKLVLALLLSAFAIFRAFILFLCMDTFDLDPKALRAVVTGVGLMVGLSWEKAFDVAIDDLSVTKVFFQSKASTQFIISAILVLLVLPGWRLYILPKTSKELLSNADAFAPVCSLCFSNAEAELSGSSSSAGE